MTLKILGRKKGMTRLFDEKGNMVVCTVIHAEPNLVTQVKTIERDGHRAIQLASFQVAPSKKRNVRKPQKGLYAKLGQEPRAKMVESPVDDESGYTEGQEISVSYFEDAQYVDVTGVSKGKGFQGVMKRYHFAGGPASHGSGFHRHGGSTGMRSTPGRCLPGQKLPGHMGSERVTVQNLRIVKIDEANQMIVVEGAIPGANNSVVTIQKAVKKQAPNKRT